MAVDLVGLVSQVLAPPLVGGLARAFGISEAVAGKLVSAAIPTILAAFATVAAAPGGAKRISDTVSGSDPDLLSNLASALGGGDVGPLAAGASLFGGLVGGSGLTSIAGALAQVSGAPPAAAQSAVGAAVQAAIGAIGREDPENWSDGPSIAALFESQKSAIAAAFPADIGKALAPTGLVAGLGDIGAAAARAAAAKASAANAAAAAAAATVATRSAPAPAAANGFPRWAIVLIVVIVLAAVWWLMEQNRKTEPPKLGLAPAPIDYALRALPASRA